MKEEKEEFCEWEDDPKEESEHEFKYNLEKLKNQYGISNDDIVFKFFKIYESRLKTLQKTIKSQEQQQEKMILVNTLLQKNLISQKEVEKEKLIKIANVMSDELESEISGMTKTVNELYSLIDIKIKDLKEAQNDSIRIMKYTMEESEKSRLFVKKNDEKILNILEGKNIAIYINLGLSCLNLLILVLFFLYFNSQPQTF